MSQARPLHASQRRDRYAAQNGVDRLTSAQKRRIARKARAAFANPDGATPKRPKAPARVQAVKGRKRFFADLMRTRYAWARRQARKRDLGKLGRYTAPRS